MWTRIGQHGSASQLAGTGEVRHDYCKDMQGLVRTDLDIDIKFALIGKNDA